MHNNHKWNATMSCLKIILLSQDLSLFNWTQQPLTAKSIKPSFTGKYQTHHIVLVVQELCGPNTHGWKYLIHISLNVTAAQPQKPIPVIFGPQPYLMGVSNYWPPIPHMYHNSWWPPGIHKTSMLPTALDLQTEKNMIQMVVPMVALEPFRTCPGHQIIYPYPETNPRLDRLPSQLWRLLIASLTPITIMHNPPINYQQKYRHMCLMDRNSGGLTALVQQQK